MLLQTPKQAPAIKAAVYSTRKWCDKGDTQQSQLVCKCKWLERGWMQFLNLRFTWIDGCIVCVCVCVCVCQVRLREIPSFSLSPFLFLLGFFPFLPLRLSLSFASVAASIDAESLFVASLISLPHRILADLFQIGFCQEIVNGRLSEWVRERKRGREKERERADELQANESQRGKWVREKEGSPVAFSLC